MQFKELVQELLEMGLLKDERIRKVFENTDRKDFVPEKLRTWAYANYPLEIGEGQTISQPYTVVFMTEALDVKEGQKILEVGSGSGYQAAILSQLAGDSGKVITTEIRPELFEMARNNLRKYSNVTVILSDGSRGFAKEEPFDRIIVTASATKVPEPLVKQLKNDGIMVIPVGNEMYRIEKKGKQIEKTFLGHFVFVPLVDEDMELR
jgi:protein-L-isoaspartate(D-aspartate) O-methyltransferase